MSQLLESKDRQKKKKATKEEMRIAEGRVVVTVHESAGGIYRIVRIV